MEKAKFKFNDGKSALLCTNCNKIIKEGFQFVEIEFKALKGEVILPPYYCKECKKN